MYLGIWNINDDLTFPCNTHATDGTATDADAVPAYRIYEDETGTAITNGNMAKLDDANTTGFYSEKVQLLAATGFEAGKCYTIYLSAAVDSTTGTGSHTFQIGSVKADVLSLGGDTQSLTDLKDFADAGYDPSTNKVQGVVLTDTCTANSDMRGTDSAYTGTPPTATQIVDEWESQSQSDPTGFHVNVKEVNGTAQTANDNGADINTLLADLTDGGRLDLILDDILLDTGTTLPGLLTTIAGYIDTEIGTLITSTGTTIPDAIAALNVLATAIKAKTDNQPTGFQKNVALAAFPFDMVLSSDHVTAATGKTVTVTLSKDGGAFEASTNSAAEVGGGGYTIDLTQAEMNYKWIRVRAAATGCDTRTYTLFTNT